MKGRPGKSLVDKLNWGLMDPFYIDCPGVRAEQPPTRRAARRYALYRITIGCLDPEISSRRQGGRGSAAALFLGTVAWQALSVAAVGGEMALVAWSTVVRLRADALFALRRSRCGLAGKLDWLAGRLDFRYVRSLCERAAALAAVGERESTQGCECAARFIRGNIPTRLHSLGVLCAREPLSR